MSNNVATNTKNEGRCSFSRKALSVATAAVLATSMVPMLPAESAWATGAEAGTSEEAWKLNDVKFTVDKNSEGEYVTTVDSIFAVASVTDYFTGKVLPTTDYQVFYWEGTSLVAADKAVNKKIGGAPNVAGDYKISVVPNSFVQDDWGEPAGGWSYSSAWDAYTVDFRIAPETVSLEGAFAYEPVAAGDEKYADTSFKYLGEQTMKAGFAVDGEAIDLSKVNVVWVEYPTENAPQANGNTFTLDAGNKSLAGTYTAKLTAIDGNNAKYTGVTTISFKVDPIDLSKDEITIAPTDKLVFGSSNVLNTQGQIMVNGEPMKANRAGMLGANLIAVNGSASFSGVNGNCTTAGTYTIKLSDTISDSSMQNGANIIGDTKTVDAVVVNEMVDYKYKTATVDDSNGITIALGYGESFNPDYLSAVYATDKKADFDWKLVDAKGAEVAPADLVDGNYTLILSTDVFKMEGKTYAGYEKVAVTVDGPNYDDAVAFATVGDTFLDNTYKTFEYTGEPFEVSVVAKNGNDKLVEGEDYTVSVKDAKGNDVESIVELGKYDVTVDFADDNEVEFGMEVTKATIESAKATAEFFAIPADGSAATPTFVGSTDAIFAKGQKFDLSADEISVEYYEVELEDGNTATTNDDYWTKVVDKNGKAEALSAEDLTEEGTYAAEITVLTTAKYISTANTVSAFDAAGKVVNESLMFKVSKAVAFSDVDANAWYAGAVYTAASEDFKYMTGLAGTALFMPMSEITRAQVAQVFFNMAGGDEFDATKVSYDDLVSGAWYGPAVAWASQAGIVTGYAGTNSFGPDDNATREQVATMIYRYMKAQGKDVAVEDEAAALAKYADGASVSDWAKTAMAWCVEQGVFGVDVDTLRPQDNLSRAEMAATSVRVQPEGAYTEL